MKTAKTSKTRTPAANPVKTNKTVSMGKKKLNTVYLVILFCYSFFIYGQSLHFEFAMDDNIMIKMNKSVQKGTAGFSELFTKSMVYGSNGKNDGAYRPVTMMSFALDKQLFGNNPAQFHFINVLLYALCGIVLFLLLRQFFPNWHSLYPFAITLLFMAHPIHTEVVANIKSRDEILSFLFVVLAMLAIFKWGSIKKMQALVVSFTCFLIACLSKESALTFVIILPVSLYFFTEQKLKDILINSLPFFAAAGTYMLLRTSFLDNMGSGSQIRVLDNTLMAANSFSEKYATILVITWKYLWLLIFPHPLSWDYSFREIPISHFTEIRTLLPLLLFIAMFVFVILTFRQKNIFAWCIIFFFATIALVSNVFIPIAATMAERFLFFPSLAICLALPYALIKIFKVDTGTFSIQKNMVFALVCGVVFIAYTVKSYARTGDWKNNLTLFEAGVKATPNSSRTHSSLAYEYAVQAEQSKNPQDQHDFYYKSIEEFKTALAIYEGNRDGWYNIAHTYDIMGDYDNAAKYYSKAIEIDPKSANSYNNLGAIYLRKKNYSPAKELFHKAIALDKKYADPYGNLGAAYHFEGNYAEAIKYYEMALAINPGLQTVLGNIEKARQSLAEQNKPFNK